MKRICLLILALWCVLPLSSRTVTKEWVMKNYTKQEVMIPMRDGVQLFTSVYTPKNNAATHPVLMMRTPYSCAPYGTAYSYSLWTDMSAFTAERYIFVIQDVRGKYMSEGQFVNVRPFLKDKSGKQIDEASDTYDTIDWLIHHTHNNGKVGVFGTSYPGFYATMAALSGHPALKAVSPQAPVTEWFLGDDVHHNGAFMLMDNFSFCRWFDRPRPKPVKQLAPLSELFRKDVYSDYLNMGPVANFTRSLGDSISFWNDIINHPDYDTFWKERDVRRACYDIQPAVLVVGGLFDAEDLFGAWNLYGAIRKQSPATPLYLAMGPWNHGGWNTKDYHALGQVYFGEEVSQDDFISRIEFPFFQYYLNNKGPRPAAHVQMFFTGVNQWKTYDAWPLNYHAAPLYLHADGSLSFAKPQDADASSVYLSDPKNPVPYTHAVQTFRNIEYMAEDQRFADARPDVLTFTTDLLTDTMKLAGPVDVELEVSISSTDADFVVSLIDVFPDNYTYSHQVAQMLPDSDYPMGGFQMLVRGDLMRGKYRESFSTPMPFEPDQVTKVAFRMNDIAHEFLPGHRLMVQIKSSCFPLFDMNPQVFTNIYTCTASDFIPCQVKIYHEANHSSRILLPVIH